MRGLVHDGNCPSAASTGIRIYVIEYCCFSLGYANDFIFHLFVFPNTSQLDASVVGVDTEQPMRYLTD